MDSQFSDIRKEYKKGKLTRNTISENPFEQFARWLNDALHCGARDAAGRRHCPDHRAG